MKLASIALLVLLCVFVDAIVDFVPSDNAKKQVMAKTIKKKEADESVENDAKATHPDADGQKAIETTIESIEGLKPVNKPKIADNVKKPKPNEIENNLADNPDKASPAEARMDHAEDTNAENGFIDVDPELNKDYGEEEDNSYDSVHGFQQHNENDMEDEANSITDLDLNHDDVTINHDDVGTGK